MAYLDKMRALCAEKGIELILIKAPTNFWRYHWYDEWDEQVAAYADQYGLAYYNLITKSLSFGKGRKEPLTQENRQGPH